LAEEAETNRVIISSHKETGTTLNQGTATTRTVKEGTLIKKRKNEFKNDDMTQWNVNL